jgi:hypothetical protein
VSATVSNSRPAHSIGFQKLLGPGQSARARLPAAPGGRLSAFGKKIHLVECRPCGRAARNVENAASFSVGARVSSVGGFGVLSAAACGPPPDRLFAYEAQFYWIAERFGTEDFLKFFPCAVHGPPLPALKMRGKSFAQGKQ